MAVLPFNELYTISECENCGADLGDWEWFEDDMIFLSTCTCGAEYTLEPTTGILSNEVPEALDDDEADI